MRLKDIIQTVQDHKKRVYFGFKHRWLSLITWLLHFHTILTRYELLKDWGKVIAMERER
jgi:hypothetical protein